LRTTVLFESGGTGPDLNSLPNPSHATCSVPVSSIDMIVWWDWDSSQKWGTCRHRTSPTDTVNKNGAVARQILIMSGYTSGE